MGRPGIDTNLRHPTRTQEIGSGHAGTGRLEPEVRKTLEDDAGEIVPVTDQIGKTPTNNVALILIMLMFRTSVEIGSTFGLKSTISRLTESLGAYGMLVRDEEGNYRLGT